MNEYIKKQATSAVKYTIIFKSVGQFCSIIASILLVRALSESDYGIYNLLYSIIGLIGIVASLGIGDTLQRYIPEYYQRGEFIIAHNLYRRTSVLRLITDIVILGLILLFWDGITPILKISEYKSYYMLFTLVVILHQQRNMLESILSSYFLHKYAKPITALFSFTRAVGYGFIIITDKNLWYAIMIDIIAYLIVFGLLQLLYFKKIPTSPGDIKIFPTQEKKRIARYAIFYNFNDAGVGLLSANFDNFIIAIFLNPIAVGAYAFCNHITIQLSSLLPSNYFRDIIKPAFFRMPSTDKNNSTLFFQSLIKLNTLFVVPILCFLLIYSDDTIAYFFNNKFIEYTPILCCIFSFSIVKSIPVGMVAQYKEKADLVFYSKIFAVYNLIADIILIKFFGIWGAVIATGTASMAKTFFIWYFVKDNASFRGMEGFAIKIIAFWSMTTLFVYFISIAVPSNAIFQLFFGVFLFTAGFIIQFKCNYFKDYEKQIFTDLSKNRPRTMLILKNLKIV